MKLFSVVGAFLAFVPLAGATSIHIYDASVSPLMPNAKFKGMRVLVDREATQEVRLAGKILGRNLLSPDAYQLNDNMARVLEYYFRELGRDSYDGRNTPVYASINVNRQMPIDLTGLNENAAWLGGENLFVFGHGAGNVQNFVSSLEIVGHEFTHAVIDYTSGLEYRGQSGALNEHLADVFGVLIRRHFIPSYPEPYLIGDNVLKGELASKARALRDMRDPSKGLPAQPSHMSQLESDEFKEFGPDCRNGRDNCGVHVLSGIPNRAAVTIIEGLGAEASSRLFYAVMTRRLTRTSNFSDYKREMLAECATTLPDCAPVVTGFEQVGL